MKRIVLRIALVFSIVISSLSFSVVTAPASYAMPGSGMSPPGWGASETKYWRVTPSKKPYQGGFTVRENGHMYEKVCWDTGWRRANRTNFGWRDFQKEVDCWFYEYDRNGNFVRRWHAGKRWVPVNWEGDFQG